MTSESTDEKSTITNKSEVARLMAQIRSEYEAAERALYGPAMIGKHAFITAHMEQMSQRMDELHAVGGEDAVLHLLDSLDGQPATSPNVS